MPRKTMKSRMKRNARALPYARKRYYKKYIAKVPNQGGLYVVRKLPQIQSYGSGVAGVLTTYDPTGSCLTLGAGVPRAGSLVMYDVPFSLKFRLNQLTNYSELTAISDKYKIKSVLVRLTFNHFTVTSPIGAGMPWVEYEPDYDDSALPTVTNFREKMGTKTKHISTTKNYIKMGVRPRFTMNTPAISGAVIANKKDYLNCANPDVDHFAIKGIIRNVYISGSAGESPFDWDISTSVVLRDIQ